MNKNEIIEAEKQKVIKLIENVYNSIDSNDFLENIASIDQILSVLDRHFNKDTERRLKLKQIKKKLYDDKKLKKDIRYDEQIKSYKVLLQYLVLEIQTVGLPSKNDISFDNQVNIENRINVNQQQSVSIEFYIGLLKDSFSESQLKELKDIVKEANTKETLKPKILQKIKDFGSDLSSNILASLISNPEIWSKMFS